MTTATVELGPSVTMADDGCALFRGLLPVADVVAVADEVSNVLEALGRARDLHPLGAPLVPGTRPFFPVYAEIQRLEALHRLGRHPALLAAVGGIVGATPFVHPRTIVRLTNPSTMRRSPPTPPHQDFPHIQGTVDCITAWVPLTPCPPERGALRVLLGSHRDGLRPIASSAGVLNLEVADALSGPWATTSYGPGDVLLFHSLTVHGSLPNTTGRLRLSVDYRYQAPDEPVVAGTLDPHWHPAIPSWDVLTAGWSAEGRRLVVGQKRPPVVGYVSPYERPADWRIEPPASRLLGDGLPRQ